MAPPEGAFPIPTMKVVLPSSLPINLSDTKKNMGILLYKEFKTVPPFGYVEENRSDIGHIT